VAADAPRLLAHVDALLSAGSRRLGDIRSIDGAAGIDEKLWQQIDPRADSLRDIDTDADLTQLAAILREPDQG
jgi:hypothetical protein